MNISTIKYRYAFSSSGAIIDVCSQDGLFNDSPYTCPGCGEELILKDGKIRARHFAHGQGSQCSSPETYLHQTAKHLIAQKFNQSVREGRPFIAELPAPIYCDHFQSVFEYRCCVEKNATKRYDLASFYGEACVEVAFDGFVADVLLKHPSKDTNCIFIEIVVTHPMTEAKEVSGNRIIELVINNEDDIRKIVDGEIGPSNAKLIGFTSRRSMATYSQCKCKDKMFYLFYIDRKGIAHMKRGPLADCCQHYREVSRSVEYHILDEDFSHKSNLRVSDYKREQQFKCYVADAVKKGFAVKNCYLCVHRRTKFNGGEASEIRCEKLSSNKHSSAALTCQFYGNK